MKRLLFLSLFAILFNGHSEIKAQIIVVEARQLTDTASGFSGNVDLNFNFNSNTTKSLSGGLGSEMYYAWKKNRLISINKYNALLNIDDAENAAVNQGYQHLRYTYDFNYKYTGALFSQIQTNPVLRIQQRFLLGGGPRFNVQPYGVNSLMFGTMLMYEYEKELDTAIVHSDVRASIYLFYKIKLGKNLSANSVTYYQPRIDQLNDFRISTSIDFSVSINDKINWMLLSNLLYDSFPVSDPGIPNLTYSIQNALNFKF
ncbi:MAG: DUF481 domain-containing protein [Cytophagales bacterium]